MPVGSGGIVEIFLPAGGTAGEVIQKVDSQNYNFTFGAGGGGGGGIQSLSAGTTQATGLQVVFSNSNGVSFGVNGATVTASVAAGGGTPFGVSAGTQSNSTGTAVFSNSNGISFGMSNSSVITASYTVPSTAGLVSAINVSAGTTSNNLSALTFSNANNVSFGLNASTITASVPSQTNQSVGIYASSQTTGQSSSSTVDARSLSVVGAGIISVGMSGGSLLVSGPDTTSFAALSIGMSTNGNTSGNTGFGTDRLVLAGGNNITLSGSTNAGSMTITISAAAGGGGGGAALSAGTQSVSTGTVVFSNSNGVSFGMSNSSVITASVAAQTNQSIGLYASSQTTGQSSSSTVDARSLTVVGAGNISAGMSAGSLIISGAAGGQTNQTLGVYATSNTTGASSSSTYDARSLTIRGYGIVSVGNSNGSILISTPDPVTLSQMSAGISGGNTSGDTGTVAQGRLVFAGGANITLSGSTNGSSMTITVSGAAGGGGHALSAGTQSGSTGTFVFSNSNGISFGMSNSSVITASYTVPTQTNQSIGIYASSQTTGQSSSSTVDARSLTVVGAGNISAGMSAGSLIISGAAGGQTNQTIGLYASSQTTGQSSSSTVDARSLSFVGMGIMSVGMSGGSVLLSGPDTTSFAPLSVGMSTNGNTAGNTGYGTDRLVFAGGNNITLSGSTNAGSMTITISGGAGGGGGVGVGVSTMGNTAGTTGTVTTGNVVFVGSGPISLSQSSSGSNATISINAPATSSLSATGNASISTNGSTISLGANAAAVSISGNSTSAGAGYSNVSTGTVILAGGNNITLSQNGASITISGANVGGAQTGISGIQVSNTTYTSGTVTFQNANGISFGSSGANGISASYTVPTQTNQTLAFYGSSQTYGQSSSSTFDARTLSVVGSGGVSVGWSNGSFLISGQTTAAQTNQSAIKGLGASNTGNTAGNTGLSTGIDWVIAGSNNITISQSTVGGGPNTLWVSGPTVGGAQTGISGIQVSNTTYTSGTVTFQNANGISFGSSGANGISASYTVPTQTNQTLGIYASSQTFGQSSSSTHDARSLTIYGSGGVSVGWSNGSLGISGQTTAAQTNQTIGLYASSQTTAQSSSSTVDARSISIVGQGNISVGLSNGSFIISQTGGGGANYSAGLSNIGNTSGDTGLASQRLVFAGGNNITLSGSTNGGSMTVTISAPNLGAGAMSAGVSNLGNTAGSTGITGTQMVLVGSGPISLSQSTGANGGTVSINAPATSSMSATGILSISTNGSTISLGVPTIVGSPGISISSNASSITVGQVLQSVYDNFNGFWPNSTTMTARQSTSAMIPVYFPEPISFGFIRMPITASQPASTTGVTTGNSQFSYGHTRTHNFVLYSRGTGANSLSLQSVASTSLTDQQSINVSANANSTQFSYTNRATYYSEGGTFGATFDYSSSAASLNFHTSNMTRYSGVKMVAFPWATSLSAGQYFLAYGQSTSSASQYTANGSVFPLGWSNYGASQPNLAFGALGSATNSSVGIHYGLGSFTTAGGGTTASVPISAVSTSSAHNKMFVQFGNIA